MPNTTTSPFLIPVTLSSSKTVPFTMDKQKRPSCILFLGRHNIALRGDVEDIKECSKNRGNFLALLQIKKKHLENPRA